MKKWLIPLFSFLLSVGHANSDQEEMMMEYYNEEIEVLEDLRDKYEAKAARFQDQGDRLQFQNGSLYEARRYWDRAQIAKEIAKKINLDIEKLKKEKNELSTSH